MRQDEVIILHISDIHRSRTRPAVSDDELLAHLLDDIRNGYQRDNAILGHDAPRLPAREEIDLVVLSGDITQCADPDEFRRAERFLEALIDILPRVDRDRVILVPGNHDVCWVHSRAAYEEDHHPTAEKVASAHLQESSFRLELKSWPPKLWTRFETGVGADQHINRLKAFSQFWEGFYRNNRRFPLEERADHYGVFDTFAEELGMVVVGFSSCDMNDHLWRRGWINPRAILSAAAELDRRGWTRDRALRIAVWHHNIYGNPDQPDFLDANSTRLMADLGFSLGFHGHIHESVAHRPAAARRELTVIGAGSMSAQRGDRPEGVPLQYNVVGIRPDRQAAWVHFRGRDSIMEAWRAHHQYGPNRNSCWVPIEIPHGESSSQDICFFPSVEHSDFMAELDARILASREVVFIGTGLNALTHRVRSLLVERARAGSLSATICFGNPYSPNVRSRLVEEERADVIPDVATAGILNRANSLVEQARGAEGIRVKFFNNYPTMAIFKFDDIYYTYPMGYRTLGNHCPVMRVGANHFYGRFLNDAIQKYMEDAVDAAELLQVRNTSTHSLRSFNIPEQICEFAIYIIPDATSRFYRAGTALLGNDLFQAGEECSGSEDPDDDIGFFRRFSQRAARYGFHMTVMDVLYVQTCQIPNLMCEVGEIAKRARSFALRIDGLREDQIWDTDLVLCCSESSGNLELVHSELVHRVLSLGLGTDYTLSPSVTKRSKYNSARDRLMMHYYHTPHVLMGFRPHFTLASGFEANSEERERLRSIASTRFAPDIGKELPVRRLYALVRQLGQPSWQLKPIDFNQEAF